MDPLGKKILSVIEDVVQSSAVRDHPDQDLFEKGLLDSFELMRLIVALSSAFAIEITPAEIERSDWVTPRTIVENMRKRIQRQQ